MITWKILNMERLPSHDGRSNVINNVYWCCYDSNESGSYGHCFGNEYLDISSLDSFTEWSSVTEEMVIEWLKASLALDPNNMEQIENAVQYGMDNGLHQEFEIGVPW